MHKFLPICMYVFMAIGILLLLLYRLTFNDIYPFAGVYFLLPAISLWVISLAYYLIMRFKFNTNHKQLPKPLVMTFVAFVCCNVYGFVLFMMPRIMVVNETAVDVDKIEFICREDVVVFASIPAETGEILFLESRHHEGKLSARLHFNGTVREVLVTDYWQSSDRIHFTITDNVLIGTGHE